MSELLKPVTEPDSRFEYEIEKDGDKYIAGVENCKSIIDRVLHGDLFLHKLEMRGKRPILEPILSIPKIAVANDFRGVGWSFERFIRDISQAILRQYQSKMDEDDLRYFFRDTYLHYATYFSQI